MDTNKKLSFQEEMEREAKKIEEELDAHPELRDLAVSKEFDDALCKRIRDYEKEQEKVMLDKKERCIKFPRKKKSLFTLVAVVTLMCAMGATGIGSKSYKKKVEHGVYGTQKMQNIDVQDMEKQESTAEDEIFAFQEVNDMIGMLPVRLGYKPEGMEFFQYKIIPKEQRAKLFYTYKENMVRYDIYKNESDSSLAQNQDDEVMETCEVKTQDQVVILKKILVQESMEERSVLTFRYKGVSYQLYGVLSMKEMKKIAENLKFL